MDAWLLAALRQQRKCNSHSQRVFASVLYQEPVFLPFLCCKSNAPVVFHKQYMLYIEI